MTELTINFLLSLRLQLSNFLGNIYGTYLQKLPQDVTKKIRQLEANRKKEISYLILNFKSVYCNAVWTVFCQCISYKYNIM